MTATKVFAEYTSTDVTLITSVTVSDAAFVDANPDTITSATAAFVTEGVLVGPVVVTDTASNDGTYTIATVVAGTLTLIAADELAAEGADPADFAWGIAEAALVRKACSGIKIGVGLMIHGTLAINVSTETSAVTIRVREGSLTGTIVGEAVVDTTGQSGTHTRSMSIDVAANAYQDDPVYLLTVQPTDANTATATVTSSAIIISKVN